MSKRLYVQLQPDEDSLLHILNVESKIPQLGRSVKPNDIHLTLIHFGIIDPILDELPCTNTAGLRAVQYYIDASKEILAIYIHKPFTLKPLRLEFFGQTNRTLVIRYELTNTIRDLHIKLLKILKHFFIMCGIKDVESYMQSDDNFKHALSVKPHITIAKNYKGPLPFIKDLRPIKLVIMPLEYNE